MPTSSPIPMDQTLRLMARVDALRAAQAAPMAPPTAETLTAHLETIYRDQGIPVTADLLAQAVTQELAAPESAAPLPVSLREHQATLAALAQDWESRVKRLHRLQVGGGWLTVALTVGVGLGIGLWTDTHPWAALAVAVLGIPSLVILAGRLPTWRDRMTEFQAQWKVARRACVEAEPAKVSAADRARWNEYPTVAHALEEAERQPWGLLVGDFNRLTHLWRTCSPGYDYW